MAEPYAPMLVRRALVGGTEETTSGTYVAPTVALANTAVYDAKLEPLDWVGDGKRQPIGNYLGNITAVPGVLAGQLTFRQHIRTGDQFIALLTGAGFLAAVPTSSMASRKTWSFALWQDGLKLALAGCAGNCVIDIEDGKPAVANWTWNGIWQTATDAALPAQAPLTTFPWVAKGITFTLATAVPPRAQKISINLGNTVSMVEDVRAASGIAYFYVSERSPTVTVDAEARLVAQLDNFGLLTAGTEHALNCVLTSGVNTLTITAPKMQRVAVRDGDRGGKRLHDLEFQCNASSGDDEISFVAA